jgi:hypothetical protein
MSEGWIGQIVENIKTKNHDAALKLQRESQRQDVILEKGPIYWRALADFLKAFVEEIRQGLEGDITESVIRFSFGSDNKIQIERIAFPAILFTAAFGAANGEVEMSYAHANPYQTSSAKQPKVIPSRFEVMGKDLVLQVNGSTYPHPEFAAQFIIEKLFAV